MTAAMMKRPPTTGVGSGSFRFRATGRVPAFFAGARLVPFFAGARRVPFFAAGRRLPWLDFFAAISGPGVPQIRAVPQRILPRCAVVLAFQAEMQLEGAVQAPRQGGSLLGFVAGRYDRRSLVALGVLVLTGAAVGYRWSDLIDVNGGMDWLLAGTWLWMAALLTWNVRPRRDLVVLAVGLGGGGFIEWWGTQTQLWHYFTAERPPLWILPAWPVAALSIDRLAHFLDLALGRAEARRPVSASFYRAAYWLLLPAYAAWMFAFMGPSWNTTASRVVGVLMLAVVLRPGKHRRDVLMFAAGALLGFLLEYWGTSRECWTYYTAAVPPAVAVFAHGFAAVVFARCTDVGMALLHRLSPEVDTTRGTRGFSSVVAGERG